MTRSESKQESTTDYTDSTDKSSFFLIRGIRAIRGVADPAICCRQPAARAAGVADKGFLAKQILPVQRLLSDYFFSSTVTCSTVYCSRAACPSFTKFWAGK
jgi:hypothetical protein